VRRGLSESVFPLPGDKLRTERKRSTDHVASPLILHKEKKEGASSTIGITDSRKASSRTRG